MKKGSTVGRVRAHFSLSVRQLQFLDGEAFVGLSRAETVRRLIDDEIVRQDWEAPQMTVHLEPDFEVKDRVKPHATDDEIRENVKARYPSVTGAGEEE